MSLRALAIHSGEGSPHGMEGTKKAALERVPGDPPSLWGSGGDRSLAIVHPVPPSGRWHDL